MGSTSSTDRDLASCLPELPGVDWSLLPQGHFVFVGTGAVNRPLARQLAWLGMKRCVLIDPKRYKAQSVVSQCEPEDVGKEKAGVVAEELRGMGIEATALVHDVDAVPPGVLEPGSLVILAVDNRRADICANRWAARMRCPLVKVNVEPAYLTASLRFYDLRNDPPTVCLECQMSDRHYEQQIHPLSCDGGEEGEQATGSPRPLSQLAANAAALAIAQIVGSPDEWADRWWGKQWQQNLLGGQGFFSDLHANPACRWDHSRTWEPLTRLAGFETTTLSQLGADSNLSQQQMECEFSARVATRVVCNQCQQQYEGLWWVPELDKPVSRCCCGGEEFAVPFFTHQRLADSALESVWDKPIPTWGVTPGSIIRFSSNGKQQAYGFFPAGELSRSESPDFRCG